MCAGTPDDLKRVIIQSVLVTPYTLKKGGNVTIAANFTLSKFIKYVNKSVGVGMYVKLGITLNGTQIFSYIVSECIHTLVVIKIAFYPSPLVWAAFALQVFAAPQFYPTPTTSILELPL